MKRFLNILTALIFIGAVSSFSSCSKSDEDEIDDPDSPSGGSDKSSYTLNDIQGSWVREDQWIACKQRIKDLGYDDYDSSTYLDDDILSEGISGYYFLSSGTVYEMYFGPTTTKYQNNSVTGNKIIKTWNATNGVTVYFMDSCGSKYNHTCSVDGTELKIGWNDYYTISNKGANIISSQGDVYIKVTL